MLTWISYSEFGFEFTALALLDSEEKTIFRFQFNFMASEKKLFLLDAFALIYRAYFAFSKNPRMNSRGENTSAIYGFTTTLLDVIQKEKPTHLAVVFDPSGPVQRHEEFTEYKAGRQAMPEDIQYAIPHIKDLVKAFNIPCLEKEGYEADDVIGTLAKQAEKEGFKVFMMTPDKDYAQLVSENIFMHKPGRGGKPAEIWGVPEVLEKFEIERVEQVIDFLGMMGDAVDNIPGLPGVGEKTAKKYLKEYGSLEKLLDSADEIKGKIGEKIRENKEKGILSKHLATIITDVPIEFDEKSLELEPADREKVMSIFQDLEFKTLGKRLFDSPSTSPAGQTSLFDESGDESMSSIFQSIETVEHKYTLVNTLDKRKKLVADLLKKKRFCFDTETTGLNQYEAELVGISFSWKAHEAYYVPIPANPKGAAKILEDFKPVFESEKIEKIAHNLKYDRAILENYQIDLKGPKFDTMLAHYLINSDSRHNMDHLAESYLNYNTVSIKDLIGTGKKQISMRDVPVEQIADYAAEDADITWQLFEKFLPKLDENDTRKLFDEVEMPLIPVLSDMERQGIKLDSEALNEYSKELETSLVSIESEIKELAGVDFNVSSPRQLGEVLFDRLELDAKAKKTKSGQYSTNEATLQKLLGKHEIIQKVLDFRGLNKLKSTYVDALPKLVNPNTGRIHTSFMQAVAATGRLSSTDPNLQNIPIRREEGRKVRQAFVPADENHVLMAADYSQIELRVIAALSEDEGMLEAFKQGQDIHAATAAKVFGVSLEEVDRDMRSKAKAVNFGIIYGQSAFGLSENLGISRTEAKEIIEAYFAKYSKLKAYMDGLVNFARDHGYVETIMKRKRYLKDINSRNHTVKSFAERNAINTPIQGSAADIIKMAMIEVHKEMKNRDLKSKMILQVHDELVFDAHKSELEELKSLVKEKMEGVIDIGVPLTTEVGIGNNWLEAH